MENTSWNFREPPSSEGDREYPILENSNRSDISVLDPSTRPSPFAFHEERCESEDGVRTMMGYSASLMPTSGSGQMNSNHASTFESSNSPGVWSVFKTKNEIPPRAAHSAEMIGERYLVIFGGWNGTDALSDLNVLDLRTLRWHRLETVHPPPKRNNVSNICHVNQRYVTARVFLFWFQTLHPWWA